MTLPHLTSWTFSPLALLLALCGPATAQFEAQGGRAFAVRATQAPYFVFIKLF